MMDVQSIFEQVKAGILSPEQGVAALRDGATADLGFARLDLDRRRRSGVGEVVFCAGKTPEQLALIFRKFAETEAEALGTRGNAAQFAAVRAELPAAEFDPVSRLIRYQPSPPLRRGLVAVCTGGTTDIPTAEEAAQTVEFLGGNVLRVYDVGVAGIHRLLERIPEINRANVIIAAAGMEGALPGVIAGLSDKPVIALPTSIGYGANFGGVAALLTMLNSCAEGLATVNIDNGFGAGYLAMQINRLATKHE